MSKTNPKITMKFLHQLAQELLFELDDKQCKNLMLEFDAIEKQMALVTKIDTTNIEPLDYTFDLQKSYLRPDLAQEPLNVKEVLAAAPETKDKYITINKVVGE
jgi:aspartyl/glutamyl-tRNA(Asn/Gln) amidotransferase C subunit